MGSNGGAVPRGSSRVLSTRAAAESGAPGQQQAAVHNGRPYCCLCAQLLTANHVRSSPPLPMCAAPAAAHVHSALRPPSCAAPCCHPCMLHPAATRVHTVMHVCSSLQGGGGGGGREAEGRQQRQRFSALLEGAETTRHQPCTTANQDAWYCRNVRKKMKEARFKTSPVVRCRQHQKVWRLQHPNRVGHKALQARPVGAINPLSLGSAADHPIVCPGVRELWHPELLCQEELPLHFADAPSQDILQLHRRRQTQGPQSGVCSALQLTFTRSADHGFGRLSNHVLEQGGFWTPGGGR